MAEYKTCKICGIIFNKKDFISHLIEKHTKGILNLRPATSGDIILGKKIIYPKINRSVKIERIIDVNDSYSAFMSERQRFGLKNAFVESFNQDDTTYLLKYEDLQYIHAKKSLKQLIENFGRDRWFTTFELPKVSEKMLYLLKEIYHLEKLESNNITYYKYKHTIKCGQYYNEGKY